MEDPKYDYRYGKKTKMRLSAKRRNRKRKFCLKRKSKTNEKPEEKMEETKPSEKQCSETESKPNETDCIDPFSLFANLDMIKEVAF